MTREEFADWWAYHNARFTGVSSWLKKFPVTGRHEGDPTQAMIADAWFTTLRNVSLADAKRATDALHSGEEPFPDKGFDCHPMAVRRAAIGVQNERRADNTIAKYLGGEITYRCHLCQDNGTRRIVHPKSMLAARELIEVKVGDEQLTVPRLRHPTHNPHGTMTIYDAAVACVCESGDRWVEFLKVRFDEGKHLEWNPVEDQWQTILDFSESTRNVGREFNPDEHQYAGYNKELDF